MEGNNKLALTINEFRACFGLGRTTIYKAISSGDLQIIKCGRRTLIPIAELDNFLDRLQAASHQGGAK